VKKTEAGNPGDWLFFANEDMNAVKLLYDSKISFIVCKSKLAEAFEKSMKADLKNPTGAIWKSLFPWLNPISVPFNRFRAAQITDVSR
jgi:hypothetical protein